MHYTAIILAPLVLIAGSAAYATAQQVPETDILLPNVASHSANVTVSGPLEIDGRRAIRLEHNNDLSAPYDLAALGAGFVDGSVEMEVKSELTPDAPEGSRGFIGIAFRVAEDLESYEVIYIRPTNGRAPEQIRRNHATQYASYPDYPWHRLREESPGHYESYADMQLGVWTHLRIEVEGERALLFVARAEQPTLIVNDLKLGADRNGAVGLWVGSGTIGYFSNVEVSPAD